MSDRKTYQVTENAGPWIAGQRKPASGKIVLTPAQAEYELALGSITSIAFEDAPVAVRSARQTRKAD